jgi:hypothetical protein
MATPRPIHTPRHLARHAPVWAAAALALGLSVGCSSKEDELRGLRADVSAIFDAQYAAYGGGGLARVVQSSAQKGAADLQQRQDVEADAKATGTELLGMLKGVAGEADRLAFEEQCLAVGRGERPIILNDKAKAFFAQADVKKACAQASDKDRKARALARELGLPQAP